MLTKKTILIIGKNSFLGRYLFFFLKKKKYYVNLASFKEIKKINLLNYTWLINCSIKKEFYYKLCKHRNNLDYKIVKKIKKFDINYLFFSSVKVYQNKSDIPLREKNSCIPKTIYGKNKLITEKMLHKMISKKLLILRLGSIVGLDLRVNNSYQTLINKMLIDLKYKGYISIPKKNYKKDVLTIDVFAKFVEMCIKRKLIGTYNLSSGISLSLKKIAFSLIKGYGKGQIIHGNEKTDDIRISPAKIFKIFNYKIDKNLILKKITTIGRKLKIV
jgi:nucleoside-diphosphate-sugar epimerase